MNPIIEVSVGGWDLEIGAYRLMLLAAIAVTIVVGLHMATRVGISRRAMAWVMAGSALGALAGARIMAVVGTQSPEGDLGSRLLRLSAGDFALYGGLIGGGLVGWALCRLARMKPLQAADALAPALGAGIVLMRVGCLLTGCCFGNPTHLPWGITYPSGSTPHLHQILSGNSIFTTISGPVPVHPFPVYDLASALTGALLAAQVTRRGWRAGSGMAVFVLWYSTWRLVLSPFRADTGTSVLPGWFWPALFLAAAVAAGSWLASSRKVMSHRGHRRFAIIGLVLSVLLAACGGSAGSDTTVPVETTITTTSTTFAETITSTQPSTTVTTVATSTTETTAPDTEDLADGSGCTPGSGPLPDGFWFGLVASRSNESLEFDLACWFTDDAATQAAAEDGEESPPPNDYYVRNSNPDTREVPLGKAVDVSFFPDGDPANGIEIDYDDWAAMVAARGYELGAWLEIEGGVITDIHEQWVP